LNKLQTIENKYNFKYPKIYHEIFNDQMLQYGEASSTWYKEIFPKVKLNPPFLLFTNEFEFMSFDYIEEKIQQFTDQDDYACAIKGMKLIPFAQSGAGDFYCFYLNEQEGENIPIVYVWHDSDKADYLSKNIQDHIFTSLLNMVFDFDETSLIQSGNFFENSMNMLKTHKKYLTNKQFEILKSVFNRDYIKEGLIDLEEYKSYVSKYANYGNHDISFQWQD